MSSILDDREHWCNRAEEARVIALQMQDPKARQTMLDIAAGYDELAERAEQRRKGKLTV